MDSRIDDLTIILNNLLEMPIFIQPPSKDKLTLPYGILSITDIIPTYGDNSKYLNAISMQLILVEKNNSLMNTSKILETIPFSDYERQYISDGIYHNVFEITI